MSTDLTNDADYVQIIQTTLSANKKRGHALIEVHHICADNPLLAKRMHELIATKQHTMIASRTRKRVGKINHGTEHDPIGADEYLIGLYNEDKKEGMFHITISAEQCNLFPAEKKSCKQFKNISSLFCTFRSKTFISPIFNEVIWKEKKSWPHQCPLTFSCLYGTE